MATLGIDPRLMGLTSADLGARRTTPAAGASGAATESGAATSPGAVKARAQAEDFEAMFLSNVFDTMFSGVGGDGPMGNSPGVAPWRSFLTQEYGKIAAKAGGVGLADHVYRALLEQQGARP